MADKLPKAHIPRYENRDKFTTQSDERDKGYIENYLNNILDPVVDQLVEDSSVLNPQIKKIVNNVQGMDDGTLQMKNTIDYTSKDSKTLVPKSYVDNKSSTLTFLDPLRREGNNIRIIYSPAEFDVEEGTFLIKVEQDNYITGRIVKDNLYNELEGISASRQILNSLIELYKSLTTKQPLLTSANAGNNITITGSGQNIKISSTSSSSNTFDENDFQITSSGVVQLKDPLVVGSFPKPAIDTTTKQIRQVLEYNLKENTNYLITWGYSIIEDGVPQFEEELTSLNTFVIINKGTGNTLFSSTLAYGITQEVVFLNNPGETPNITIFTDYSNITEGVAIRFMQGVDLLQVFQRVPVNLSNNINSGSYTDDDVKRVINNDSFDVLKTTNKVIPLAINEAIDNATTAFNNVNNRVDQKQDLLTQDNAGTNITITGSGKDMKISATGGSGTTYHFNPYDFKVDENNNVSLADPVEIGRFPTAEIDTTIKQISQILPIELDANILYTITFEYGSYQTVEPIGFSLDGIENTSNVFFYKPNNERPTIFATTLPFNNRVFIDYNLNDPNNPQLEIITDYSDTTDENSIQFISGIKLLQIPQRNPVYIGFNSDSYTDEDVVRVLKTKPIDDLSNTPLVPALTEAAAKIQQSLELLDNRINLKADKTYVDAELLKKQDKLIAGSNIQIVNNVISATSTNTWIKGELKWMESSITEMPPGWVKIDNTDENTNTTLVHNYVQPERLNDSFGLTNDTSYASFSQTTKDDSFTMGIDATEAGQPVHINILRYAGATLWRYDPDNEFI